MTQPVSVSAIIPVYNGERFLKDAIESVLRQQGEFAIEIIVVDDGSTDDTPTIVQSFGEVITYVRQENAGPGAARNNGLQRATGEYVGLLDADDLWRADKLMIQVPPMLNDDSIGLCWGNILTTWMRTSDDGTVQFVPRQEPHRIPQLGSLLFRRSVFDNVGLFETGLRMSDDFDLLGRVQEAKVPTHYHEDVVLEWRRHDRNITGDVEDMKAGMLAALKHSLDRKRAQS